jgi:hypothetical protein
MHVDASERQVQAATLSDPAIEYSGCMCEIEIAPPFTGLFASAETA